MEQFSAITSFIQVAVLAVFMVLSVRLLIKHTESLTAVFLSFVFGLWFLSNIYWLIYNFLRPDIRMPFAANEIGEAGMILMIAAIVNSAVPHGSRAAVKQIVCAVIFTVLNVILWIAWSGEWIEDIITGLVLLWLLSSAACSLKVVHALTKAEWISFGIYSAALLAGQGLTFLFEDPVKTRIDIGCYVLISLGILYWLVKLFMSYKCDHSAKKLMALAVTNLAWIIVSLFMSSGVFYTIYLNIETLSVVFLYLAAEKVVKE